MKIILIAATATVLLTSCASSMITANNPQQDAIETVANTEPVIEKQTVALSEVPTMVLASLNKSYPKGMIQSISKVKVDKAVYYRFVINEKRKKFPVVFNENAVEEKNSGLK